jgi:hypothetical protein
MMSLEGWSASEGLVVYTHRCELSPNPSGLSQLSEADGPANIPTGLESQCGIEAP